MLTCNLMQRIIARFYKLYCISGIQHIESMGISWAMDLAIANQMALGPSPQYHGSHLNWIRVFHLRLGRHKFGVAHRVLTR